MLTLFTSRQCQPYHPDPTSTVNAARAAVVTPAPDPLCRLHCLFLRQHHTSTNRDVPVACGDYLRPTKGWVRRITAIASRVARSTFGGFTGIRCASGCLKFAVTSHCNIHRASRSCPHVSPIEAVDPTPLSFYTAPAPISYAAQTPSFAMS